MLLINNKTADAEEGGELLDAPLHKSEVQDEDHDEGHVEGILDIQLTLCTLLIILALDVEVGGEHKVLQMDEAVVHLGHVAYNQLACYYSVQEQDTDVTESSIFSDEGDSIVE